MKRLRHSYAGYLRSMQMSSTSLFIFVEGKQSDPYFYARICASIPDLLVSYEIRMARELPQEAGGKQTLLSFFSFLRQSKALVSSLGDHKTSCIFFLDKDVDDLQHKKKRSQHVVYTEHYDVQNYIFKHGDLLTGAASAASIEPARLCTDLGDAPRWCLRTAKLWREWIALCLRAVEDNISCEANYRIISRVQTRPCGPTDTTLYAAFTRTVARRCHLPVAVFRQQLATSIKKVDRYFGQGQCHRIFRGKWFAVVLADDIDRIMAGRLYDKRGLTGRLTCCVAATIDFSEPWAEHFRNPIRVISGLL